jgi:hypothetical protein
MMNFYDEKIISSKVLGLNSHEESENHIGEDTGRNYKELKVVFS